MWVRSLASLSGSQWVKDLALHELRCKAWAQLGSCGAVAAVEAGGCGDLLLTSGVKQIP